MVKRYECMNKKICDILFLFICISLIFNTIPQIIQIGYIGGIFSNKLITYLLIISLFYTMYCEYKYSNILKDFNIFKIYIYIYI